MTSDKPSFAAKVAIVAGTGILVALLYQARQALLLVYASILLAVALSPTVRLVERWALRPIGRFRLPRPLAILLVYLLVVGTLGGVVAVVARPIAEQAQQLWTDLPALLERAQRFLVRADVIREPLSWEELFRRAPTGDLVGTLATTGLGLAGGIVGVIGILVLAFYLLVESQSLFDEALRFVPSQRRTRVRRASAAVIHKVSAWLGGNVLLGAITGGITALVLGLTGIPYFYVLAILSFVGEFVPYVGPLLAGAVGLLIGLSISWSTALWVGLFFLALQQLENHLLAPQVFERQVGLSAATVIVALLIGGELLGIGGVILAIPTAAIIQVILEQLVLEEEDA